MRNIGAMVGKYIFIWHPKTRHYTLINIFVKILERKASSQTRKFWKWNFREPSPKRIFLPLRCQKSLQNIWNRKGVTELIRTILILLRNPQRNVAYYYFQQTLHVICQNHKRHLPKNQPLPHRMSKSNGFLTLLHDRWRS